MWKKAILFTILLDIAFGAMASEYLETSNFEFLSKYSEKQYRSILHLRMSNSSISKVDPKLKYLKNLEYLDLSQNNIQISTIPTLASLKTLKLNGNSLKSINMAELPPNIETLDISNNFLSHIPKDWKSLRSLRILYLHKNPIDCECINVMNYNRIIKSGITVPESVSCHSPSKYLGKDIGSINCSLGDIMLYDEAVEGSGASDIFEENRGEDGMGAPIVADDEDYTDDNITIIDEKVLDDLISIDAEEELKSTTETPLALPEEGSGDEGSGIVFQPESGVLGCIEDCSTPGPIGSDDEDYASPLPNIVQQIGMLWEDLNVFETRDVTTTPQTATVMTETTKNAESTTVAPSISVHTTIAATTQEPVTEPPVVVLTEKPFLKSPKIYKESEGAPVKSDAGNVSNVDDNSDKMQEYSTKEAVTVPKNSTAVYAIIGILVFVAVIFLICFVKKRHSQRRSARNRREEAPNEGDELKPLSKSVEVEAVNELAIKSPETNPEDIPLINGRNGHGGDSPILKSFIPLKHPEGTNAKDIEYPEEHQSEGNLADDVEMRPKYQPELLTPQRERVTIRESEIPDSIPKTPMLVHRQKNSEGEIITTVVP